MRRLVIPPCSTPTLESNVSGIEADLCPHCGAAVDLRGAPSAPCAYCGTPVRASASSPVEALRALGVSVAPTLRTREELYAEAAERDAQDRARRRTTLLVVLVGFAILALFSLLTTVLIAGGS
jgi:hypothetical protein